MLIHFFLISPSPPPTKLAKKIFKIAQVAK